jgi:hypothetical protein
MTPSMDATLTTIGRQLQADYSPILAAPLPREIEGLLARLAAREAGTQRPVEQAGTQS